MTKTTTTPAIDSDAIGIEVSWSYGYGDAEAVTLPRQDVRNVLAATGWPTTLLPNPDEDMALRRARNTVKGRSKEIVVQELRRPNKDTPRAFGIYKVIAKDGESGDDIVMGARVRCGAGLVLCLPPEDQAVFTDTACESVGNELARIANSLIDNAINTDISALLVEIGWNHLGWINRRRNSGGVYFISSGDEEAADQAERFIALLQGIAKLSHERAATKANAIGQPLSANAQRAYHFIPQIMEVYPKPLSMSMWKDSAQDQYQAQTEKLLADLKSMQSDDKMRDSTIQARADECDRLIKLAETHRLFLEDAVGNITFELNQVKNAFDKKLAENAEGAKAAFDAIDAATPAPKRRKKKTGTKAPAKPAVEEKPDLDAMSADDLFGV